MVDPVPVSVVVATHNRCASLMRLLDALGAQTGVGHFEVVVVDDASTDDTASAIAARPVDCSFSLRCLRLDRNCGPATARNHGWRVAAAPLVCFTDDDCQPTPTWLSALCARLAYAPVVQGRTVPDPAQVDRWGPWSHTVEVLDEGGFYETCNMGYRRSVLERLGGFDEAFRRPYGEDADLAWRAREAGIGTAFAADAVVHHDVSPSSWPAYIRGLPRREALVRVASDHPDLRANFPAPWFTRKTHPAALGTAAALAVVAARPRRLASWLLAAATVSTYYDTVRTTRRGPSSRVEWAFVLPLALVADLTEVAILARASVRHRTLLI